jgi:hypothetical protein
MSVFRSLMIANAAADPLKMPLTFTAEEVGATVALNVNGTLTIPGMHYRMGKSGAWMPYTAGTAIPLNIGESVQFWNSAETLSVGGNDYATFAIPKKVAANGNVQSMLNWRKDCPAYCFCHLFYSCRLTKMPELPAETIGAATYWFCFYNNNYLTETTLICAKYGIASYSFESMFRYCGKLSVIRTLTPRLGGNESFYWVNGVSPTGTFYKTSALAEVYGYNNIPEGWDIVDMY